MALRKVFSTDPSAETNGVEFPIYAGKEPTGVVLLLARAGGANKAFDTERERAFRKWRQKNGKRREPSPKDQIEILIPVVAKTCVRGWWTEEGDDRVETIEIDEGQPLTCTPDNAETLLRVLPEGELVSIIETITNWEVFKSDVQGISGNSESD